MKTPWTFTFSIDSRKILISSNEGNGYILNVYDLITKEKQFIFTLPRGIIRINSNNQIFTEGIYRKIQMFSNNWYTVGVKPNLESKESIFPNPATEYIEVNVRAIHELPLQEEGVSDAIRIFDIFGNEIHPPRPSGTPQEGNKYRIDVSTLQSGVYFVRIGNEKPMKFVIVR
ncbi:MAG: hypothetical protein A2X64_00285 [Ignavibacteria bacterium GWF2_33_9]|nr:MAG: hypothetical protein A2X64_00285 [Ignavibacteria bacterium GWF2_33_9]